jgi:mono/diheme cytochrome c family protein
MKPYVYAAGLGLALAASLGTATHAQEPQPQAYFTEEQAERGERAYLTNCSGCHGYEMLNTFAGYGDADDFHSVISLTMPWEDPGMLPDQFYIDMVAYMLRENGFPAGDTELAIDRELLRQIDPGAMADPD